MSLDHTDCQQIADALDAAIEKLPGDARSVRVALTTMRREYLTAAKFYTRAEERGLHPEILPAGGLPAGGHVMLGAGPCLTRRVSPTGIETQSDGYWGWTNLSSPTTPFVACDPNPIESYGEESGE